VRDWFNENRVRTRRDEFGSNGRIRRTIHLDLHHNLPQQEIFYRSDGTLAMRKRLVVDPGARTARVDLITLLDGQGHPTRELESNEALKHLYLDSLVGDERTFLIVESRRSDRETLTYQRSNVKQIYVLHNPHLTPPGDDPSAIRGSYRQLFDHRDDVDAIVFLTKAQRADAEAEFGERTNFRVIPHPMPIGQTAPFEDRDRDLVVMLARLDQQKQLSDAVVAFAQVVTMVPTARLEIYGEGPDRNKLQHQIDDLGLSTSVTLMGYTKDPTAVYRRAALSMLTSKFEGFGLVLLESLSRGCPVISYDVKYGPSDIITNGVNGYLVRPGDTHELATRVVEVLGDEPLRRQLSERAAQPNAEFSQEAFVARWSELFRDLDGGLQRGRS
jgi:glycosyltransferase involved in cell wall biosynthesis